jgi:hypothetical protein
MMKRIKISFVKGIKRPQYMKKMEKMEKMKKMEKMSRKKEKTLIMKQAVRN